VESIVSFCTGIQLFQLRLSPSKAQKSNTKINDFLAIPNKPFALAFDFSALLGDNLN
jgi:hypothetical protein